MNRINQKTFFHMTAMTLLVAGLGMLTGCGGGGGGGAAPATAPGAFSMTAPANSSSSIVPTPTLAWGSASGATTYTVEVTMDNTFAIITTFSSTTIPAGTTSIVISSLSPSTVYYWRVKAVNSLGSTTASGAPFSFTTMQSGDVAWSQTNDPSLIYDDQAYGMAISGANMYVVGFDSNTALGDDQWHIEKRALSDGSLIASFGTAPGIVVSNPSSTTLNSFDDAYAVAVDSTALYAVGFDSAAGDDDLGWRIEKRDLVTGASIAAFGTDGVISENFNVGAGLDDVANAVAVDSSPTGTMYIVGLESTVLNGTEWRIEARNKADGSLISSVTSSISPAGDEAFAIAIDPSEGYMYVAGSDSSLGNSQWRIEKRTLSAPLSLETITFGGTLGYVLSNPSTTNIDKPLAIALDSSYLYVAGYDNAGTVQQIRIEKRDRFTGAPVPAFGTDGAVNSNTTTSAAANAIVIDSNYIYVAGYDNSSGGHPEWRIEKRDITTGVLVATFGSGGVVVNDFGLPAFDHDIWTIAVDAGYIYVAGYESVDATNSRWRISKIVK